MKIKTFVKSAPGRVALVGNPFDIYGGSTISLTLNDLRSYVKIEINGLKHQGLNSQIFRPGNNRASQRCELEHAVVETLDLQYRYFNLFDTSNMPYESGLARSTAAVIAMIRAFNDAFNLGIKSQKEVAELAWQIERKLGVCGGQERYAIAHDTTDLPYTELIKMTDNKIGKTHKKMLSMRPGRLFYMDFKGREDHRFRGQFAYVEELAWPARVKIGVIYSSKTFYSSFDYHKALREIFENSDKAKKIILRYRDQSDMNSLRARVEFLKRNPDVSKLGECMNESFNYRQSMLRNLFVYGMKETRLTKETKRMHRLALEAGAIGANQPGSKSICFVYQDDRVIKNLKKTDYHVIKCDYR